MDMYDYNIDRRKLKMIQMILDGVPKTVIAQQIGVSRQAIYDWLKDPEVQRIIKEEQEDIIEAGKNKMIRKLEKYVDKLDELAIKSGDARTQNSALQYLVDRIMGKAPTRIESTERKEDAISDDVLNQAIDDVDSKDDGMDMHDIDIKDE
jgi:predicted DNA-binding protein YlxM (UPF0122 family)